MTVCWVNDTDRWEMKFCDNNNSANRVHQIISKEIQMEMEKSQLYDLDSDKWWDQPWFK